MLLGDHENILNDESVFNFSMPTSYYQYKRIELVELLPEKYSKVMEVGCGTGNFYKNLSQDCEYWGIEPFQAAANIASQTLHEVLIGTFEEVYDHLPDEYFDLVICNDVIEHMNDHEVFFKSIKQKMKRGSYIIGSIPNVRFIFNLIELLIKKDWVYKDEGILDRTHLRFFTEKSLKRTIIQNNFVIEKFYGVNKLIIKPTSLKNVGKKILIYIFGRDTQFLQFGFRIKYN